MDDNALNRVQPGMHVIDASGEDVGRVDAIHMGDPSAVTTAGNEDRNATLLDHVAESLGGEAEPDVPEPLRSRLIREGYLKLDSAGLLASDRYVPADCVRGIADDRVQLSVRREELVRED
jgi:hypothetical protein